jgi:hypothetical protein
MTSLAVPIGTAVVGGFLVHVPMSVREFYCPGYHSGATYTGRPLIQYCG